MRKLSHNKKRNLSLVYEFLTREVSAATIDRDPGRAAEALDIIRSYLGEGCVLHEELMLQRNVMETRGVSRQLAQRIVDSLKASALRLSATAVLRERAKSEMIHEMNRRLGRDIFDRYRIPDYTAHASCNIVLSRGLGSRIEESVDAAKIEEHLVGYLMSPPSQPRRFDPNATMVAYNTAVGIFEKEIGHDLDSQQRDLIREYVRVSLGGSPEPLRRATARHRDRLRESLLAHRNDEAFKSDREMAARLDETIGELRTMEPGTDETLVERLILIHNVRKEIES